MSMPVLLNVVSSVPLELSCATAMSLGLPELVDGRFAWPTTTTLLLGSTITADAMSSFAAEPVVLNDTVWRPVLLNDVSRLPLVFNRAIPNTSVGALGDETVPATTILPSGPRANDMVDAVGRRRKIPAEAEQLDSRRAERRIERAVCRELGDQKLVMAACG